MNKKCPICNHELKSNSYIKDTSSSTTLLELIIKDENLKKTKHELKATYCPKCGHVDLWIDLDQPKDSK